MGMPSQGALIALNAFRPVLTAGGESKCELVLIKEAFTDVAERTFADLVEADYKGYSRKEIRMADVGAALILDGVPCLPMSLTLWTFDAEAAEGEDNNAIYGWAIIQHQPDAENGSHVPPKLVIDRRWPDGAHGEPPVVISAEEPAFQFAPRIAHRFLAN